MTTPEKWSQHVTGTSHGLDLEPGVFTWHDPRCIAASLKASAEASTARMGTPCQSTMSMLNLYNDRAGGHLDAAQRAGLEQAKAELRALFGRDDAQP